MAMIGVSGMSRHAILAAIMCLSVVSTGTRADDNLKKVFEARYAALEAAMVARDRQAISALLAPGFESIDVSGAKEGADQMIQEILALPKNHKESETTILSVKKNERTATVIQRYHMTTNKPSADGRETHAIELMATSTDTWIESGSTWLNQQTRTDEFEYKEDGKIVVHESRDPGR